MLVLTELNQDVLHHMLSYCSRTALAMLATTCKLFHEWIAAIPRAWQHITVFAFTHHMLVTPHIALRAHGRHILRITLGQKHSAAIHWTHVPTHTMNVIARHCTNLQQLFMYTHESTVTCDAGDMVDVLAHCTHLRELCIPYKLTQLQMQDIGPLLKQRVRLRRLVLFGKCLPMQPVILFSLLDAQYLRVLKLTRLRDLDLPHVLRYFYLLETLVVDNCVGAAGSNNVACQYPLHTLRTLKIHNSPSVVRNLMPVTMSLQHATAPLPLQYLAADSDDAAFVRFAFTVTCGQCNKVSNRRFNLLVDICGKCSQQAAVNLKDLRRLKFYNTYTTRF